jgi:hypothetical protein
MHAPAATLAERTAYHEVGHALAALLYGIPIRAVTVEGQPHLHRGELPFEPGLTLEALLTLCLAGPECERLHCGAVDDGGDTFDIEAAFRHLRRELSALEVLGEYARARDAAAALVSTPWARRTVPRLVRALIERGTLSGEDLYALLSP